MVGFLIGAVGAIKYQEKLNMCLPGNGYMKKSKELKQKIDALPICKDGKKGVADIIRALGHDVEEDRTIPSDGEVWRQYNEDYIVVALEGVGVKFAWLNEERCILQDNTRTQVDFLNNFTKIATSLKEYYANKD